MAFEQPTLPTQAESALEGFMKNFAMSFTAMRQEELKRVDRRREELSLADQEMQKFQLDEYTPVMEKDMGNLTPEQISSGAVPTVSRARGVGLYIKRPKEYAPKYSTPEQILSAKNSIRDDINKKKTEMWDAFPILSSAAKDISNLGTSEKIYDVLSDKSDWLGRKTAELDNAIASKKIPEEMRDPILTEIKNMIPLLGDYKYMSERLGHTIKTDRELNVKPKVSQKETISNKSSQLEADITTAKQAIQAGADVQKVKEKLEATYGKAYNFDFLLK